MKKVYTVGIVAGLIPAAFKTILFLVGKTEIYGGSYTNLAELVVVALTIPFSVYVARKENDGLLTFNNALKTGIGTAAITGVIVCLFTYLYFKYMNTAMYEQAVAEATKYVTENNLSAEEAKKNIEGAKQFYSPFVQATSALFGIMLAGFFISVISAVVLKKEQ